MNKTHTKAQCITHTASAVVLEAGKVVKARYISDGHHWHFGPTIVLADKTVILKAAEGDVFTEGEILSIDLGVKDDARFGKMQALLGYRRSE